MKLVIELSENDYKALKKDGVQNHLALADTIIACGVPYKERLQGDSISREVLKKATKSFTDSDGFNPVWQIIDNAPSVDIKDQIAGAYNEGYACGSRENARPHGEWICKTKSTFPQYQPDEYKCPFCNVIVHRKTNYCEYCGADMRKGGAE